jgi:hypothetical protein
VRSVDTYLEAATALGLDDGLVDANFMASTRDGGLVAEEGFSGEVDGTMAVQSRPCGPTSNHPGSCNVTGFDGQLLGRSATPDAALRFDAGRWCLDAAEPSFLGVAALSLLGPAILVRLDPAVGDTASVGHLAGEVWQVPRSCTLEEAPCGGERVATGRFLHTVELEWERW